MISKRDWQSVHEQLIAEDREAVGIPPSADDLLAYERGELSGEAQERVRRALLAYPDLARAVATSFDEEDDEPLASDVVDRQWASFAVARPSRKNVYVGALAVIAAAFAVVFGTMLGQARSDLRTPRVITAEYVLTPDGDRGSSGDPAAITARGDAYMINVALIGAQDYETYRLEIVSDATSAKVWASASLRRTSNDSFNIEVPSTFLKSGRYRVVVFGLRGNASDKVATYTFDIR